MPKIQEANKNPFDNYDEAYEKKGAKIQIAEQNNRDDAGGIVKRAPAPGGLERRVTHDGLGGEEQKPSGGGFLSRVKSLKGGPRRGRPDRG